MNAISIHRCIRCGALNRMVGEHGGKPVCGRCKVELDRSGAPQPVRSSELERTIADAPVPVLVDFWASWCGPCRMAAPIFDELGRNNSGRFLLLKVDVDADPEPARRYKVSGIPTFILFQGGREVARRSGLAPRAALEQWIASHTNEPRVRAG